MPFKSLVRLNDQACFQPSKTDFLGSRRQSKIITHAHPSYSSWRQKIESFGRRQSHWGVHGDSMSWIHLKFPVDEMEGLISASRKLWVLLRAELSLWCWLGASENALSRAHILHETDFKKAASASNYPRQDLDLHFQRRARCLVLTLSHTLSRFQKHCCPMTGRDFYPQSPRNTF